MITLRVRYCYVQSLTSLVSPEITRHDHSIIVRDTYMYGVVLHAHPICGESHNQRNTTGEVATSDRFSMEMLYLTFLVTNADINEDT